MTAIATLRSLGACEASINWASRRRGRSPQELWSACLRGDWLAWYLGKLGARDGHGSPAHRRAVLVACLCARTASHYWRNAECEQAVTLTERWAWGDETATRAELRNAAYAARAADYAAAAYAYTAARAAYAADAYAADAYADARTAHLASLADLIRAAVPEVPL